MINLLIQFLNLMGFSIAATNLRNKFPERKSTDPSFMDKMDKVIYNKWFVIGSALLMFLIIANLRSDTGASSYNSPISQSEYALHFNSRYSRLADLVKERLHDPKSFEFVKSDYTDNKDGTLAIIMTYRAKNGFGAVRTQRASAELDLNNKVFRKLIVELD